MRQSTDTTAKLQSSLATRPKQHNEIYMALCSGAGLLPHILDTELDHFVWKVQLEVAGVHIVGGDFRAVFQKQRLVAFLLALRAQVFF